MAVKVMGQLCLLFYSCIFFHQTFAFVERSDFKLNSSDYKVLLFLSQSCPCSKSHVEHVNQLAKQYENVSFYGVVSDRFSEENSKQISKYYKENNFTFPLIKDEKQILISEYNALKTPHVVILKKNENNKFKVLYEGGVSDKRMFERSKKRYLSENLQAIASRSPIKYSEGKSLGCYIRRF